MIRKEDLIHKINTIKKFAEETEQDSKKENNISVSVGYKGLAKGYKHAAEILEQLLEGDKND